MSQVAHEGRQVSVRASGHSRHILRLAKPIARCAIAEINANLECKRARDVILIGSVHRWVATWKAQGPGTDIASRLGGWAPAHRRTSRLGRCGHADVRSPLTTKARYEGRTYSCRANDHQNNGRDNSAESMLCGSGGDPCQSFLIASLTTRRLLALSCVTRPY